MERRFHEPPAPAGEGARRAPVRDREPPGPDWLPRVRRRPPRREGEARGRPVPEPRGAIRGAAVVLSHKVLTRQDVGRAASYYADGADDYYAGEGEASAWQGKGAEALGLDGPVDDVRFRELLAGEVDRGGPITRATTRRDTQSRIGIDLTFSAPKSVSIQALVGGDERIVAAHDRAVARAIAVAEERAQTRKKVKGESHVEDT